MYVDPVFQKLEVISVKTRGLEQDKIYVYMYDT